jgi:hypothetical protein
MPQPAWFLGWLAPATACLLLTLSVVISGNSAREGPPHHDSMVAMMLSNQSYAAYVSDNYQSRQNGLPSVTFDLTNRSGSAPGPYWRGVTN